VVPDCIRQPDRGVRRDADRVCLAQGGRTPGLRVTNVTAGVFVVIVVANLLSVIAEAGFNWDLPSDPTGYLLFKK
jgi:hypothetical protein